MKKEAIIIAFCLAVVLSSIFLIDAAKKNNIPTAPKISVLSPTTAYKNTTFYCNASGSSDLDRDELVYYYEFRKGKTILQPYSNNNKYKCEDNCNKNDAIICYAKAYDLANFSAEKTSSSAKILNSPPLMPADALLSAESNPYSVAAYKNSMLSCSASLSSDVDSDDLTYYYELRANRAGKTIVLKSYSTSDSFKCTNCIKNDIAACFAKAYDRTDYSAEKASNNITIINFLPTTPAKVQISPALSYKSTKLTCSASGSSDADNDKIVYYYEFWKNGEKSKEYSADSSYDCSKYECKQGDYILCRAKAYDNTDYSFIPETSNEIKIENNIPTAPKTATLTPAKAYKNTEFNCTASGSTDSDNDALTYYYEFRKGKTILQPYSNNNRYKCEDNCNKNDAITCYAKAYDLANFSAEKASNIVKILNTLHVFVKITDDNSTFEKPTNEGANVVFKATASNIDNDNYFLVACSTNNSNNGNCESGKMLCKSALTFSGEEASCLYSTKNQKNESYGWHSFACDGAYNCIGNNENSGYYIKYSCNDSDNGKEYNKQGNVFSSSNGRFNDSCLTADGRKNKTGVGIKEYFCNNFGIAKDEDDYNCEDGCKNGECIVLLKLNVSLYSNPVGNASVYIDDIYIGNTNLGNIDERKLEIKNIRTGKHSIRVEKEDYASYNENISISLSDDILRIELKPIERNCSAISSGQEIDISKLVNQEKLTKENCIQTAELRKDEIVRDICSNSIKETEEISVRWGKENLSAFAVKCVVCQKDWNLYLKGKASMKNQYSNNTFNEESDYCYDENFLVEGNCESDNKIKKYAYVCLEGCNSGKCNKTINPEPPTPISNPISQPTPAPQTQTCIDSDNGKNELVKGSVRVGYYYFYDDSCINEFQLREYSCENNNVKANIIDCQPNFCNNGKCSTCTDSDNGLNYISWGNAHDVYGKSESDYCSDSDYLNEYYCSEDYYDNERVQSRSNYCQYGCQAGECRQKPEGEEGVGRIKCPASYEYRFTGIKWGCVPKGGVYYSPEENETEKLKQAMLNSVMKEKNRIVNAFGNRYNFEKIKNKTLIFDDRSIIFYAGESKKGGDYYVKIFPNNSLFEFMVFLIGGMKCEMCSKIGGSCIGDGCMVISEIISCDSKEKNCKKCDEEEEKIGVCWEESENKILMSPEKASFFKNVLDRIKHLFKGKSTGFASSDIPSEIPKGKKWYIRFGDFFKGIEEDIFNDLLPLNREEPPIIVYEEGKGFIGIIMHVKDVIFFPLHQLEYGTRVPVGERDVSLLRLANLAPLPPNFVVSAGTKIAVYVGGKFAGRIITTPEEAYKLIEIIEKTKNSDCYKNGGRCFNEKIKCSNVKDSLSGEAWKDTWDSCGIAGVHCCSGSQQPIPPVNQLTPCHNKGGFCLSQEDLCANWKDPLTGKNAIDDGAKCVISKSEHCCVWPSQQQCQNDCASGQTRCFGIMYKQTCGNYDADSCLEWPSSNSGSGNEYCQNGCENNNCKLQQTNCGNGVCDSGENNANCPNDCPAQPPIVGSCLENRGICTNNDCVIFSNLVLDTSFSCSNNLKNCCIGEERIENTRCIDDGRRRDGDIAIYHGTINKKLIRTEYVLGEDCKEGNEDSDKICCQIINSKSTICTTNNNCEMMNQQPQVPAESPPEQSLWERIRAWFNSK